MSSEAKSWFKPQLWPLAPKPYVLCPHNTQSCIPKAFTLPNTDSVSPKNQVKTPSAVKLEKQLSESQGTMVR